MPDWLCCRALPKGCRLYLMGALAMGRPVITTSIAGIPELVQHKVSGWLIPPGSVEALVSAVCDGLATPVEQLNQMGRAGAAAVARQHNVATEAVRLAELFHDKGAATTTAALQPGPGSCVVSWQSSANQ